VNILIVRFCPTNDIILDPGAVAGWRRRTAAAGQKEPIKILCLTVRWCSRAYVDADETGVGRVVHDLNVIEVVIGHDVRDWCDFVDQDAYVGAGCHVTRGVGKDGQILEYRVSGLVDFKDRSPSQAVPEQGCVSRSRSPCCADRRFSLRLAPVHRDSRALRNGQPAGELDRAGVR